MTTYHVQAGEQPEAALRRIAGEQIQAALEEIDDGDLGLDESVHEVRKRCKKIRGLLRLVRPAFSDYSRENKSFRDVARGLSELRDAAALVETCDALSARFSDDLGPKALADLRLALEERREKASASLDAADRLEETRKVLRAKYHRYHLTLLHELWPPVLKPLRDCAKRLGDRLGDDHDLAVLRRVLVDESDRFARAERELALRLVDVRRRELLAWSHVDGQRLLAHQPKHMQQQLRCCWNAWVVQQQLGRVLPERSESVS